MRSTALYLLGGIASANLDCASLAPYQPGTIYNAGDEVVYDGHKWHAHYYNTAIPSLESDGAWTDEGLCSNVPEVPTCASKGAMWSSTRVYETTETVIYEQGVWRNAWYSLAGVTPPSDTTNWARLSDCTGDAPQPGTTTTTPAPGTTTTPAPGTGGPGGPVPTKPITGPNGECIWPYIPGSYPYVGSLVGMGNKVYASKWWTGATEVPGESEGWVEVGTCIGTAPKAYYTDDEMRAMLDPEDHGIQVVYDPETAIVPSDEDVRAAEAEAAKKEPKLGRIRESTRVLPIDEIEAIAPLRAENPENVRRVESIVSESDFDRLFPVRHAAYTYNGFLKGVGAFPDYCHTYSDRSAEESEAMCRRLLAISFAHSVQEVGANTEPFTIADAELLDAQNGVVGEHTVPGALAHYSKDESLPMWKQALYYVREMGMFEEPDSGSYRQCDFGPGNLQWALNFQCYDNQSYFGRGAKQLSYNFNYGPFSKTLYGDERVLLQKPSLVADTWLNFASGFWFAVTPQSPKPAMTWVVDGTWVPNEADKALGLSPGFGATIIVINGGVECGYGEGSMAQVEKRIYAYKNFAAELGVTVDGDEQLGCPGAASFPADSAAKTVTYWDEAGPGHCQIVEWQTPFSVAVEGDYKRCINYFSRSHHWKNGEKIADYGKPASPIHA